jgi:hypothetical protein
MKPVFQSIVDVGRGDCTKLPTLTSRFENTERAPEQRCVSFKTNIGCQVISGADT